MAPPQYWVFRTLRRLTPQRFVDWMLDHSICLKPGDDTKLPGKSVESYAAAAAQRGTSLKGQTVCVVGFGGGFGIALHLLQHGARHVVLQDPFAPARSWKNRRLDPKSMRRYFDRAGHTWIPRPDRVTLVRDDLPRYARARAGACDVVVSNSVLEHVSDPQQLVTACALLTRNGGLNVHCVDLRDHYFRYPFEMLCYRRRTWQRWLNASNNLNRWRLPQYGELFRSCFSRVDVQTTLSLPEEFRGVRHRLRREFLTGDPAVDAAATIRIIATK